ncbi:hypothetical protein FRC06_008270, partial [Ceratobasidium sp. 370]
MSDSPVTPKRPQRRAAQEFAERLPLLTGSARLAASHLQSVAANPSTPNQTTAQPTNQSVKSTQNSNASPSHKGKRKAVEEPPGYAVQPEPLPKRVKSSTTSMEAIMSSPYDQLTNPSHHDIWLRNALFVCRADDLDDDMSVSELESLYHEILDDPDANANTNVDNTPQANLGVSTGSVTPMSRGRPLTGTDHTTIGFMPAFGELPRDENGKPDLLAVALDNTPPLPSASKPGNINPPVPAPAPAHAEIRRPHGKPSPDLRRAVLKRSHNLVNSAMVATQGGQPATASPKGSQSGLRINTQSSPRSAPTAASLSRSVVPGSPIPCPTVSSRSGTPEASSSHTPATSRTHAGATLSTAGTSSSRIPATSSSTTQVVASPAHSAKCPTKTRVTGPPYPTVPARPGPQSHNTAPRKVARASVVPPQPALSAEPEEGDKDKDQAEDQAPAPAPAPTLSLTKRQRTQLCRFGPIYEPVVKKAEELIWLRMLTQCAFPEVTPAPVTDDMDVDTDDDDENPIRRNIFDEWIPKCWARANHSEYPNEPLLVMEAVHRDWIQLQVPQPRTSLKGHLEVTVPIMYGFRKKKCTVNLQLSENLIHQHAFIFVDPDNVKTIFRHPCIGEAIYSVFFKNKGVGSQYRGYFKNIPISLIAFACTVIRHVICEYRDGEWKKENLSATLDARWYWRYVARLEQLARDTPTRLTNIQEALWGQCLGDELVADPFDDSKGSIDLGSDSEPEAVE